MNKERPAILVIDDSATIRKMVISALRALRADFSEAGSGIDAIESMALRRYHLIILDLNMPDMHGLEFLQLIRKHSSFQTIPVIVLTSRNDESIREAALSAGANVFMTKPFDPNTLLEESRAFFETTNG